LFFTFKLIIFVLIRFLGDFYNLLVMKIGNKINELRKGKGLNREALGKLVGTSGAVIGRYERDEIVPSVEMAKKIADALDVSLDFLVGGVNAPIKDQKMLYRLDLLEKITPKQKETVLEVLDSLLQTYQISATQKKLA
jgi:transcriptional regulator with XRE-family HTH domain